MEEGDGTLEGGWKLTEEVAGEVCKLMLTHCPCLRPGSGAGFKARTSLDLPSSWEQKFHPKGASLKPAME